MTLKKKILSILFWSVVSAAFIGPGTVTIATQAGVNYGFTLLWALVFSTFATLLLQEASARLAINTKLNLGQAIAMYFDGKSSKAIVLAIVIIAIILGCAAYEAGNILGAVAGLVLIFEIPYYYFVIGIGIIAVIVLNLKSVHAIAQFMGFVVITMGIAFFVTSISLKPDWGEIIHGSFVPIIPAYDGAGLIVLGLIGTTVIPYDLFLGSGALDKNQTIKEMRFGLTIAIVLGGIISMSIMGVGNAITEGMTSAEKAAFELGNDYSILKNTLELYVGEYVIYIFGFGMFAAGFSSAVTSPLASAITASSLFSNEKNKHKWTNNSLYFKLVAAGVLFTGLTFGILDVKPVPAIIIAQAFNGLILPLITIFLIFVINDVKIVGRENLNRPIANILMGFVLWITMMLGFTNIAKAVIKTLGLELSKSGYELLIPVVIGSLIISALVLIPIFVRRAKSLRQEH